jgi:hypothetical protein
MKRLTSWCAQLTACFLLAAAIATPAQAADAKAADPTGTWTWTQQGRGGGEGREVTMKIKKEGDKYVGTMTGRQGAENELKNVKVTGDEISFDFTREVQGNSFTAKYKGKIADDTIKGKITSERDGQTNERDWTAKRKKDDKKDEKKEAAK